MSHLLDSTWLCRYPHPRTIVFDNGSEFKGDLLVILKDYGIKARPTTVKKPQANSILERVHQVLGDMLRTKNLVELDFSLEDTWPNILASVAYAIRSTAHTTLGATPAQLVFRRDMVMPLQYIAQWDLIKKSKQEKINYSNTRENSTRVDWDYKVDDLVLISDKDISRKLDCPTKGPYKIVQVFTNGTVLIQYGAVQQRINIRRCTPYFKPRLD